MKKENFTKIIFLLIICFFVLIIGSIVISSEVNKTNMVEVSAQAIKFKIEDLLGQRGLVVDMFVETGSPSNIILATGGAMEDLNGKNIEWKDTKHSGTILCKPHKQGNQWGIRIRINFVDNKPPKETYCWITLMQEGAKYFKAPVKTTPAP